MSGGRELLELLELLWLVAAGHVLFWIFSLCLLGLWLTVSDGFPAVSSIQILRQIEASESLLKFQAQRSSHVGWLGWHANGSESQTLFRPISIMAIKILLSVREIFGVMSLSELARKPR